ncbi:putative glycosyl hydrolase (beta-glucosidase) [Gordonia spumicola]|uniref:Putative glycosyl hydrolase (Beta-glucosidase) n=1 Tax=Gordonia spumicola TaxID=589161 RepID=A0A7I9V5S0_9ACTN|nr:family 1 glycosylhydrolase [Gordonia spumicola]GEE00758.1 putative glycosyl hydrolase (beta-glucosidase) [Gordonia spumicola]GEE00765.1 putative glycosyl hydrolase (beta-glucosidase) [Gordonia spumicola]GEE01769.1 putative glycosyl hydrolase (beta-glucosidase) [Gordonia spumicola]
MTTPPRRILSSAVVAMLLGGLAMLATPPSDARVNAPLPDDFLWGVSASGFQTEGSSPDSNWSRYAASTKVEDPIGTAVDFRHHYREDVERARSMGMKVYRVSIEWSRIEPSPGRIDTRELAYYDDLLAAITGAGMRPMLTLDHWVLPGWIADRGGWADARTAGSWLRHQRMVVDRYAHLSPLWITVNEPTLYIMNEVKFGGISVKDAPTMASRLVAVHRGIYDYIHHRSPGAMVSSTSAYIPAVQTALDVIFQDGVRDKLDYIAFNSYYSLSPAEPAIWTITSDKWKASVAADGIYYAFRDYSERFPGKPLYVVETGMPTEGGKVRPDGYKREDHLRDLVYWTQRARNDGINVMGFNYWSLTDNYEWGSYTPRFGLYTVNVKTDPSLTRHATPAVSAYRDIARANGVGPTYRPSRPASWCSLVQGVRSCVDPVR